MNQPPVIDQFIDHLLSEINLTQVPAEFLDTYRQKIKQELETIIAKTILISLPESRLDQFEKLATKKDATPEEVEKFLQDNIKDYPEIITEELQKFKEIFLAQIKKKQNND